MTDGRLYNWHAVADERGLCPSGWTAPSRSDLGVLGQFLGGSLVAGDALKASPSDVVPWGGLNTSGLTAIPSAASGMQTENFACDFRIQRQARFDGELQI